jgi:hypothetical protein
VFFSSCSTTCPFVVQQSAFNSLSVPKQSSKGSMYFGVYSFRTKFAAQVNAFRVTRLAEFSPFGLLFSLGSFYENYRSSTNSLATFSTVFMY